LISLLILFNSELVEELENTRENNIQILKCGFACFFGSLGTTFFSFGIGIYVFQITGSPLSFGLSQLIGPLLIAISSPINLFLIQKFNKRYIILSSRLIFLVSLLVYAFSMNNNNIIPFFSIVVIMMIHSVLNHLFLVSYDSAIRKIIKIKYIHRLKAYEEVIGAIALIISPIMASYLIERITISQFVFIVFFIESITFIILCTMKINCNTEKKQEATIEKIKKCDSIIKKDVNLIRLLLIVFGVSFLFGSVNVGMPYLQIELLDVPLSFYGYTKAFWSFGIFVSGVLVLKNQNYEAKLQQIFFLPIIVGFGILIMGVVFFIKNNLLSFFIVILLFNFFQAFTLTRFRMFYSTWISRNLPTTVLSQYVMYQKTIMLIASSLGLLVFGVAFTFMSFPTVLLLAGVTLLVFCLMLSFFPNNEKYE